MCFRLAAYAVCIEDGRVLLAHYVSPTGDTKWTLPGGKVEHAEDPFDAVIREVAEETGCEAVVERLLGVDSRVIPAAEALLGIQQVRLPRRNTEELGVELIDLVEESASASDHLADLGGVRVVVFCGIPTCFGDRARGVGFTAQQAPVALRGFGTTRKPAPSALRVG